MDNIPFGNKIGSDKIQNINGYHYERNCRCRCYNFAYIPRISRHLHNFDADLRSWNAQQNWDYKRQQEKAENLVEQRPVLFLFPCSQPE